MTERFFTLLCSCFLLVSCIENDLPLPVIEPVMESLEVEGAESVVIDQSTHTVRVVLDEVTDITAVKIGKPNFKDDLSKLTESFPVSIDLSQPFEFNVRTYQDYTWTIAAEQNIERYFTVSGQVGKSVIDERNRRAIAYVSPRISLSWISVNSLKLGPRDITEYSRVFNGPVDFSEPVEVSIIYHGRTEQWTLYVDRSETLVDWVSVDAWTRIAWLTATGIEGSDNGFRYRLKGDEEWIEVDAAAISSDGGTFTAGIDGLEPQTTYECIAYSGNNETLSEEFTTGEELPIPNAGFEVYSKCESQNYYSFYDPESMLWNKKWWDSGNYGSTTVGSSYSICMPDTDEKAEGEASSRMDSRYVVIKFAAGNMFSGEFGGLVGIQGGKVNFGRPFTARPQALKLSLKYKSGKIDYINSFPDSETVRMGDDDKCQVFIALGCWDYRKYGGTPECPVQVNTTDRSSFFNPASEDVIAYGVFESDKSSDGWEEITIPLDYRSRSKVPTHIIISCAASKYGDYFTGSASSTLWVDDMKLIY